MNDIKTITVRAEGEINCFWTILHKDGTETEYWSCDQESPVHVPSDKKLWDTNPKLCEFLQNLWYDMDIPEDMDCGAIYATFTHTGKLIKTWVEI